MNTRSNATFSIEIIDYVFAKGNPGIIVYFEKHETKSMHYLNIKRDEHGNWIKNKVD